MDNRFIRWSGYLLICSVLLPGCKGQTKSTQEEPDSTSREKLNMTLFDKSLPEIQEAVNGKWKLVSGQNSGLYFEFDDTVIEFKGNEYTWTDEDGTENGSLNWRQNPSGNGYDAWFTDVFYEENPTYMLAIKNDTLFIQDISNNLYLYKLAKK